MERYKERIRETPGESKDVSVEIERGSYVPYEVGNTSNAGITRRRVSLDWEQQSESTVSVGKVVEPHNGGFLPVLVGLQTKQMGPIQKLQQVVQKGHSIVHMFTTLIAAYLTLSLIDQGETLHPQIATVVVILLVGTSFPQLVTAAGCGAFVGANGVTTSFAIMLPTACCTAVAWAIVNRYQILLGYGGRMGTTTFLAFNISMILFLGPSEQVPWNAYGSLSSLWADRLELEPSLVFCASTIVLATVSAFFRLNATVPVNPVLAPVTAALTFMIALNGAEYKYRDAAFNGAAVGIYVAMASESKLPTTLAFCWASVLAAAWGLCLDPFFLGFPSGGFTALLGHVSYEFMSWLGAKCIGSSDVSVNQSKNEASGHSVLNITQKGSEDSGASV